MKRITQVLCAAGFAAALSLTSGTLTAQNAPDNSQQGQGGRRNRQGGGPGGPGNFDPAQMRERMMERYREQLGVKDDAEWKLISDRIEKVLDARRAIGFRGFGMFGGGRGGGRPPGGGGDAAAAGGAGGGGGGAARRNFGGETSPEAEALQKAIDSDAPADEIKSKLSKYRTSVKEKEAKLDSARDELKKVLSVKQEAAAVLADLLK